LSPGRTPGFPGNGQVGRRRPARGLGRPSDAASGHSPGDLLAFGIIWNAQSGKRYRGGCTNFRSGRRQRHRYRPQGQGPRFHRGFI